MAKQPDGLWIIDALADILGTTMAGMIGESSFTYLYPEDVAAVQRLFDGKRRGDSNPFHFRLRHKDSSVIWVDVQGTPLSNAVGEFLGIVGTFSVSDRAEW